MIELAIFTLRAYYWMIIACVFISFFPEYQSTGFYRFMANAVEPYVSIFRKIIPPLGVIDLSVIVSLFVLHIAIRGLARM